MAHDKTRQALVACLSSKSEQTNFGRSREESEAEVALLTRSLTPSFRCDTLLAGIGRVEVA